MMDKLAAALQLLGLGFFVGISILGGVLAGLWLDEKLHTRPALVIAGLILGIVVAFYGVYKMLVPLLGDRKDKGNG